jgi:hypothetical protein
MPSTTKNHKSTPRKKSYSSPSLTHFGAIQELTSGGAGSPVEGKGDMDMNRDMG